ncbi:MAG: hypothetical protein AAGF67_00405 [Verrucomicrobiota bacterium]
MKSEARIFYSLMACLAFVCGLPIQAQNEAAISQIVDQFNAIESRLDSMRLLQVDATHADSDYGIGNVSVWVDDGQVAKVKNEVRLDGNVNSQEAWLFQNQLIFFFERGEWHGSQDGSVSLNEYRFYLENGQVIREMSRFATIPRGQSLDISDVPHEILDDFEPDYGRSLFEDKNRQTAEFIKTVNALAGLSGGPPDLLSWPHRLMLHTLSGDSRYAAAWGIDGVARPDWKRWETERYDYFTALGDPATNLQLIDLATGASLGPINSDFEPGGSAPYFWMKWAEGNDYFISGSDYRWATGPISLYRVDEGRMTLVSDLSSSVSRYAMDALREADHPYAIDATDAIGFIDLKRLSSDGTVDLTFAIESKFEGTRRNAAVDLTVRADLATGNVGLLASSVAPFEAFPTSWEKFRETVMASAGSWLQSPPAVVDYLRFETFIPDGVQHLYNLFGGFLNQDLVEVLVQKSLFVSGPHYPGGLVPDARFDFGHYNPEAVRAISDEMGRLLTPEMVSVTQDLYRTEFSQMAKHFQEALHYWHANPGELQNQKTVYLNHLKNETLPEFYYLLDGNIAEGLMGAYSEDWDDRTCYLTALRFWLRRSCDGSYEEFASLLQQVLAAYDPAYFAYRGIPDLKLEAPSREEAADLSKVIMDETGVLGINHLTPFDLTTLQNKLSGFSVEAIDYFDQGGQSPAFEVKRGGEGVLTLIRFDAGDPLAFELRSTNISLPNGITTGDSFADVFQNQRPLGFFNGLETDIGAVVVEAPGSERVTLMFHPPNGETITELNLKRADITGFVLTEMRWMP